jgi:hypothetical protein
MMRDVLFGHLPPWEQVCLFPRNSPRDSEVSRGRVLYFCQTRATPSPSPPRFYLFAAG